MNEKLIFISNESEKKIADAKTISELNNVKAALIGKQGALTEILKEVPKMEASERAETGRAANLLKNQIAAKIDARAEEIQLKASEISSDFDFTVPGIFTHTGGLHPITQMCYDLNDTFRSMGFEIFRESDISSEYTPSII